MMDMPSGIKVAVPIDEDELIDSRLLLILRDQAWRLFHTHIQGENESY
jgi:hypothetical protein